MHGLSEIAAELLVGIVTLMGQPSFDAPRIVMLDAAELQQRVCGRSCRVYAWYAPDGAIYFDNRLDPQNDIVARGILVHELVHHIQRKMTGRDATDCAEWAQREHEAFVIQAKWLRKNGVPVGQNWFHARRAKCVADAG